jgi:hypothetical protein
MISEVNGNKKISISAEIILKIPYENFSFLLLQNMVRADVFLRVLLRF